MYVALEHSIASSQLWVRWKNTYMGRLTAAVTFGVVTPA